MGQSTSTSYTVQHELTPGVEYAWQVDAYGTLSRYVGTTNTAYHFTILRPEHDLSVSMSTPRNVHPSTPANINATVCNFGLSNESSILVQFMVNRSLTASKVVSFLRNASSVDLGFKWTSPSIPGTYNLTAYVTPVLGESSLGNNRATSFVAVDAPAKNFSSGSQIYSLSCSVSPLGISKGDSVTVWGSISPAVSGQSITLMYTGPDGNTFSRNVTCTPGGSYSDSYSPEVAGSWSVAVSWVGDAGHSEATNSGTFTVSEPVDYLSFLTTLIIVVLVVLVGFVGLIFILTRGG